MMNKSLMYAEGIYKICGEANQEHTNDCPGAVIESLTFRGTYEGPNCGRGCCGYTEGEVSGETVQEVFDRCVEGLVNSEAITFHCNISMVSGCDLEYPDITDAVNAKRKEQQDRKLAVRAASVRQQKLAKLEAEKADLTPEAYERRLSAIMSSS
jgi:hypothetical protein